VLCNISACPSGACHRYANVDGVLTRLDPLVLVQRAVAGEQGLVRLSESVGPGGVWANAERADVGKKIGSAQELFVTGIGSASTCQDYKPGPFIVSSTTASPFTPPAGMDISGWPATIGANESWYFKPDAGQLLGSPANADDTVPHDVAPEEIDIASEIFCIEAATTLTIRRPNRVWA